MKSGGHTLLGKTEKPRPLHLSSSYLRSNQSMSSFPPASCVIELWQRKFLGVNHIEDNEMSSAMDSKACIRGAWGFNTCPKWLEVCNRCDQCQVNHWLWNTELRAMLRPEMGFEDPHPFYQWGLWCQAGDCKPPLLAWRANMEAYDLKASLINDVCSPTCYYWHVLTEAHWTANMFLRLQRKNRLFKAFLGLCASHWCQCCNLRPAPRPNLFSVILDDKRQTIPLVYRLEGWWVPGRSNWEKLLMFSTVEEDLRQLKPVSCYLLMDVKVTREHSQRSNRHGLGRGCMGSIS